MPLSRSFGKGETTFVFSQIAMTTYFEQTLPQPARLGSASTPASEAACGYP